MSEEKKEPVTIKKYANRRLYNTGTSTYVTLEDLAAMVKSGEDFIVFDAKTGEEITRSVLAQIIFEQENKEGQSLLPIAFLRQLIRFYGDSMQMLVPRFLEASIDSLTKEQGKFREQITQAFGVGAFGPLEDQVRRNMEMFEKTFAMFAPFARGQSKPAEKPQGSGGEMDDLKRQLDEMQKRLVRLGKDSWLFLIGATAGPGDNLIDRRVHNHPFATPQANLPFATGAPVNVNGAWHTACASDEVEGTAAQH